MQLENSLGEYVTSGAPTEHHFLQKETLISLLLSLKLFYFPGTEVTKEAS